MTRVRVNANAAVLAYVVTTTSARHRHASSLYTHSATHDPCAFVLLLLTCATACLVKRPDAHTIECALSQNAAL